MDADEEDGGGIAHGLTVMPEHRWERRDNQAMDPRIPTRRWLIESVDDGSGSLFGLPVEGWTQPDFPGDVPCRGRLVQVRPLDPARDTAGLWEAFEADPSHLWDYLPFGPFKTREDFGEFLDSVAGGEGRFLTVESLDGGSPLGIAAFLRIDPPAGSVEIGSLVFSSRMRRTAASTDALIVMLEHAFDLGYRRVEWKCNVLNAPSIAAAQRLGMTFEGLFRHAAVVKGRNRDTAWFSLLDSEWPEVQCAARIWLSPENFADDGRQKLRLSDLTTNLAVARFPNIRIDREKPRPADPAAR